MAESWSQIDLEQDPTFVVGQRKVDGKIKSYRVEIHEDTFDDFRQIAQATLAQVDHMTARSYAPFGALDEDEYFALPIHQSHVNVPTPVQRAEVLGSEIQSDSGSEDVSIGISLGPNQTTEALDMVRNVNAHEVLHAQQLRQLNSTSAKFRLELNLYAISFPTAQGRVGFIRRTGPRRSISPGHKYFQFGDTLTSIDQPDFVLDDKIDVVVGTDEILLLSDMAAQMLFRDVRLALEDVPKNVDMLAAACAEDLPLSADTIDALREYCGRGPRPAKRLHGIANGRIGELSFDNEILKRHGLDILIVRGQLYLTEDQIPDFFDYLEGRLYHDDHTSEPRRADRFSKRSTDATNQLTS